MKEGRKRKGEVVKEGGKEEGRGSEGGGEGGRER